MPGKELDDSSKIYVQESHLGIKHVVNFLQSINDVEMNNAYVLKLRYTVTFNSLWSHEGSEQFI